MRQVSAQQSLISSKAQSPKNNRCFLFVQVWDLRQARPTLNLAAHAYEILSADWCKYNDCVLATASVDKSIKLWDIRAPDRELSTLLGHT